MRGVAPYPNSARTFASDGEMLNESDARIGYRLYHLSSVDMVARAAIYWVVEK